MFTILKVRDDITTYEDPAWYDHPEGTVAESAGWEKVPVSTGTQHEHGGKEHAGDEFGDN